MFEPFKASWTMKIFRRHWSFYKFTSIGDWLETWYFWLRVCFGLY